MKYIDGITVAVNQLDIKLVETISIPTGCKSKIRVKFELSGTVWDGIFPKIAVFRAVNTTGRNVVRDTAIINGYAVIPSDIISEPHNIVSAGIKMIDDEGGQVSTKMVIIGKTSVGAAGSEDNATDPLGEFLTEFAKISAEHFETSTQKIKDYAKEIIPSFEDWFHYNARYDQLGVQVKYYDDLFTYNVFNGDGEIIETIDLLKGAEHGEKAFVQEPTILVCECPAEERPQIIVEKDTVYGYLQLCQTLNMPDGLEDGHEYVLEFETRDGVIVTMKICKSETEPWHIEVYESDCDSKSYYYWEDHKAQDGIVHFTVRAGVWFDSIGVGINAEKVVSEDGITYYREKHLGCCLSRTLFDMKCINSDGAEKFKDMFATRPYAIINDCGYYLFDAGKNNWVWAMDGERNYTIEIPTERWGWDNRYTFPFCGLKPEESLKLTLKSGNCESVTIVEPRAENLLSLECTVIPEENIVVSLERSWRKKGDD